MYSTKSSPYVPVLNNSAEDQYDSRRQVYSFTGGITVEQEIGLRFMEALVRRHTSEGDPAMLATRARQYTEAFCLEFGINH